MTEPLNIALIVGSSRRGRIADRLLKWLIRELSLIADFSLDVIDAREYDPAITGQPIPTHKLEAAIERADAMMILTAEYNHSFPAPLKAMLDAVGAPWRKKPVGFISYGGISGGLRAVEQLRLVVAELDMVGVRESVSISNPWSTIAEDGEPADADRLNGSLQRMTDALLWWATVLKAARRANRVLENAT